MAYKYSSRGIFATLAARKDSEHNQILVRVAICVITLVVIAIMQFGKSPSGRLLFFIGIVLAGVVLSVALFLLLLWNPSPSHSRRVVAIAYDYSALSAGMIGIEDLFAFGYCYLLWITVGYGIRYGKRYRIATVLIGMSSFLIVISMTEVWKQNLPLSVGLLLLLGAIPTYQVGLLSKSTQRHAQIAKASEAKTKFLAKLSHELRTPLNGIVLLSEMLSNNRLLSNERIDAADTIQKEAMMMLGLVQEVLHVSEIEAGKITVRSSSVNVLGTVKQVSRLFKPMAAKKGLKFNVEERLGKSVWLIDEMHFRQIIVNVVSNAVKFTEHGSVTLVVAGDEEEKKLSISVKDTGSGMTAHTLANLFNPYQGARRPPDQSDGSGLGMHITKALVDAMNGTIDVSTQKGSGTTIDVVIPAVPSTEQPKVESIDENRSEALDALIDQHAGLLGSKWIMIIDDVESNLMIVTRLLQEAGHKIVPMTNPAEALASFREMSPDMILVDFHMPQMNAPQFIRQLRALRGGIGETIPVVVMTADASKDVLNQALEAGATTVVHKPVQAASLFGAVERGLSFGAKIPD